jgi:hypothetical protein
MPFWTIAEDVVKLNDQVESFHSYNYLSSFIAQT